jgi:hypothetical protein
LQRVFDPAFTITVPAALVVWAPVTLTRIVSTCSSPRVMVADERKSVVLVLGLTTAQVKLAEPLAPVVSSAVTLTIEELCGVEVPEMSPVEGSIESPPGSPVADHVSV